MSEQERVECLAFETPVGRFAVEAGRVRELVTLEDVTPVPDAPASVAGITTVRGNVVVVLSGTSLFDVDERLLVVLDRDDDRRLVGLAVADVAGVQAVETDAIATPGAFDGATPEREVPTKAVVLPFGDAETGQPTFVLDTDELGDSPPDPPSPMPT